MWRGVCVRGVDGVGKREGGRAYTHGYTGRQSALTAARRHSPQTCRRRLPLLLRLPLLPLPLRQRAAPFCGRCVGGLGLAKTSWAMRCARVLLLPSMSRWHDAQQPRPPPRRALACVVGPVGVGGMQGVSGGGAGGRWRKEREESMARWRGALVHCSLSATYVSDEVASQAQGHRHLDPDRSVGARRPLRSPTESIEVGRSSRGLVGLIDSRCRSIESNALDAAAVSANARCANVRGHGCGHVV